LAFWSISIRPLEYKRYNQIIVKKICESVVKNYKTSLQNKIFEVISQASQELNVDSYVIGGFLRDLLLKRFQK
jgi:hypothetical protein